MSSSSIKRQITWQPSLLRVRPIWEAFDAHWRRILADPTILVHTILWDGQVAGSILSYEEESRPKVSYWLGKEFWGKGLATMALKVFLAEHNCCQANDSLSRRALYWLVKLNSL